MRGKARGERPLCRYAPVPVSPLAALAASGPPTSWPSLRACDGDRDSIVNTYTLLYKYCHADVSGYSLAGISFFRKGALSLSFLHASWQTCPEAQGMFLGLRGPLAIPLKVSSILPGVPSLPYVLTPCHLRGCSPPYMPVELLTGGFGGLPVYLLVRLSALRYA